jgi:hypothetical protein
MKKLWRKLMSILTKKLHILKTGGTEQTANIYTTQTECPTPNLKVGVDGSTGYVKLGDVNHRDATDGRINTTGGDTYAILKTAHQSDFPSAWGAFVSMSFSRTFNVVNGTRSLVYAWSLHFENGVLPVRLGLNDASATIDQQWYTAGAVNDYNSARFVQNHNTLYNARLVISDGYFEWSTYINGVWQGLDMISTGDAAQWGLTTDNYLAPEFAYSVSDGVVSVYKNGALFQSFNV